MTLGYDQTSGRLTTVTDWTNRAVRFGYDASGRLQTVTDRAGQITTYGYDGTTSHLTTITDANQHVAVTMTYDSQGRVATQKDAMGLTTGQQTTFSYPPSEPGTTTVTSPITSFDGALPTMADTYDTQGRLTQRVIHPSASETYTVTRTYDANSNVSTSTDGRGNTTTLCWDVDYSGAAIAGSQGNLTREISPPPVSGVNPLVTLLKYDGKHNPLETVAPKGVGNGGSVSCSTNLAGLGSVRALTDGSGTVVQTYRSDAYGVPTSTQGAINQHFQYAGQERDEDGLIFLRGRVYNPTLGRFLQRDPLAGSAAAPLSLNRYTYAGNNPTSATDPSGLLTYFIGGIGGGSYPAFVQALQASPASLQDVQPQVCAFESCNPARAHSLANLAGNIPLELARAAFAAENPLIDSDAQALASQVKRDRFRYLLSGEQLNFIGYSGGATVAFDAAVILQQHGIFIDNIVTLGGFIYRGKPGNVGTWTAIVGYQDLFAFNNGTPDLFFYLPNVAHIPMLGLPSYLTGYGATESMQIIHDVGLR